MGTFEVKGVVGGDFERTLLPLPLLSDRTFLPLPLLSERTFLSLLSERGFSLSRMIPTRWGIIFEFGVKLLFRTFGLGGIRSEFFDSPVELPSEKTELDFSLFADFLDFESADFRSDFSLPV